MKKNCLLSVFSISLFGLLISNGLFNQKSNYNSLLIKDKEYVVIFDNKSDKNLFNNDINKFKDNIEIKKDYSGLFEGYLINCSSSLKDYFSSLSSIKIIEENKTYKVDYKTTYDGWYFEGAVENNSRYDMGIFDDNKQGEGTLIAVFDAGFNLNHSSFKDLNEDINVKLEKEDVDKIVNSKDFLASNFDKGYYFNRKIPYYHDYGGTIKDDVITENSDPISKLADHGMYVSSAMAGNGDIYKGSAPNAQFAFFNISSQVVENGVAVDEGLYTESCTLEGLNDAYLLGCDVINFSWGNSITEQMSEGLEYAIKKLDENDVIITVAAGNTGKENQANEGVFAYDTTSFTNGGTTSQPGSNEYTLGIGSSNISDDDSIESEIYFNDEKVSFLNEQYYWRYENDGYFYFSSKKLSEALSDHEIKKDIEYIIIEGDASNSSYSGKDVKDKIVVISASNIEEIENRVEVAKNNKAIGCIIYLKESLGDNYPILDDPIPLMNVDETGYNLLKDSENKVLTISKKMSSSFSSEGSTDSLTIVNELVGPGNNVSGACTIVDEKGNISNDGYTYSSGTSVSSPNVAGALADILSETPSFNKKEYKEYKESVKARAMSTATILLHGDNTPISVRKQGAGLINVDKASKSKVYLTGNTKEGAKIELKNNDDIKNGYINFDFTIHNENKVSGSYKAKLLVTTNDVINYESNDEFNGQKLKSQKSKLIDTYEFNVSLNKKETQDVNVSYSLKESAKSFLDQNYELGNFIEGYLVLTPTSSSLYELNIPFLGYYNDYSKVSAVEPFDFEKEEGKIYESDLVNSYYSNYKDDLYPNYSSLIKGMSSKSYFNIDRYRKNSTDLNSLNDVKVEKEDNKYHIYTDKENKTDKLYIQVFANRNCNNGKIEVIDNSNNILLSTNFLDILNDSSYIYKGSYDGDIHKSYAILDMSKVYNGTFTLRFTYNLADNTTQYKEYAITNSGSNIKEPENKKDESSSSNLILYIIIGVSSLIVVIGIILVVVLINKKKKKNI